MESSQILSKICEIRNRKVSPWKARDKTLRNYQVVIEGLSQQTYISAEVHIDGLDQGEDLTPESKIIAKQRGTRSDRPAQYISKRLGGVGICHNAFPLNSMLDTTVWDADEAKVYDFVKKGGGRYARLMFGMEYEKKTDVARPFRIFYHFELFEDGKIFGSPISNVFENKHERFTNPRYYGATMGSSAGGVMYYNPNMQTSDEPFMPPLPKPEKSP